MIQLLEKQDISEMPNDVNGQGPCTKKVPLGIGHIKRLLLQELSDSHADTTPIDMYDSQLQPRSWLLTMPGWRPFTLLLYKVTVFFKSIQFYCGQQTTKTN